VVKSENSLPSGIPATSVTLGAQMLHCITLRKTASGYQVVEDKFVTRIFSGVPNSSAIQGHLDVKDKGKTYTISLKTYPMSAGSKHDRLIGEFAY